MTEVRYKPSHAGNTPEERIRARGRNSGVGKNLRPDVVTQNREGWHVNIHNAGGHVKPRDTRNVDIRAASRQKPPSER
jgi:hypothetical protein